MSSAPTTRSQQDALAKLEAALGYSFERQELLHRALTHKSFSKQHNERLEFIGDAVLGYLVGIMLYRRDEALAEDSLSLMREFIRALRKILPLPWMALILLTLMAVLLLTYGNR